MTLRAHAKSIDMRQRQIAERMHALGYPLLDQGTISRYLNGDLPIPEDALPMLAAALRVPASECSAETEDDEEPSLPQASGL